MFCTDGSAVWRIPSAIQGLPSLSSSLVYGWFPRALVGLCHRTRRFSSWQDTMPMVMPMTRLFDSNTTKSRRLLRTNVTLAKRTRSRFIWNLLGPREIQATLHPLEECLLCPGNICNCFRPLSLYLEANITNELFWMSENAFTCISLRFRQLLA